MAFKLMQENGVDHPVLVCDVCGNRIYDPFGDLASGTRVNGGLGNVVIHHRACPTTEEVHLSLVKFFALFATKGRYGDLASDGLTEKAILPINIGEQFE